MNFNPAPKKYPTWADVPDLNNPENWYRKRTVGPWEQWFAWRPVKVHGKRTWLKTVYRRIINTYVDMDDWARYEYGTIFDVLTD
jgi:hypothetical protein